MERRRMKYVRLGSSGLKVSRLILGTMQYGSPEWQPWVLDEDIATQHIKAAYELGVQTFDASDVYSNGIGERILGNVLKRLNLPREEIVVMTKIGHFVPRTGPGDWIAHTNKVPEEYGMVNQGGLSRKHIFSAIKASLERLQLDYVDVIQCHCLHPDSPMEEVMIAFHDVIQAGYARYLGMGGACYAWQFQYMQNFALNNKLTPFISIQNLHNLIYRVDEDEMYPMLKLFGVGSIPFSPLARGHLARPLNAATERSGSDKFLHLFQTGPWKDDEEIIRRVEKVASDKSVSMAQIALAWLLHQSGVTAPIIGPTSIEQLKDAIGALDVSLSDEQLAFLEAPYKPRPSVKKHAIPYSGKWEEWLNALPSRK